MKLTVKVKLLPSDQQKHSLLRTMEIFNSACDYISQVAFKEKKFSQVPLHRLTYRTVREKFSLSAQFVIRALGKVAESYKVDKKTLHKFKKYSAIVYDQRLLSFKSLDLCSILTVDGRYKIPIVIGKYVNLEGKKLRGQADLIYQKGKLYLCLVVEFPDGTQIDPDGVLGVDLGIVNLATTSDGEIFSGKEVEKVRTKATQLKSALQKCGSPSAKRHLKKFSGRERRFKKHINHVISKRLISIAKDTKRAIAIEDLKGFRKTVRKADRERFGKWAFNQLRQFIEYKAKLAGIPILLVNPRNTSRICSQCGYMSKNNRKSQSLFSCKQCGNTLNADINGARNIASIGAVNHRIVTASELMRFVSLHS